MIKLKPFRQSKGYCGPACLKMVLEYFGVNKTEKELAEIAGSNREHGTRAKGLAKAAKKFGFKTIIKDFADISDLRQYVLEKKIPVIVNWFDGDDGHYSIILGLDDKKIYLMDPEIAAIRKIPLDTFMRVWFDYFPGDYIQRKRDMVVRRMIAVYR
jgi:predicted double-glycine peptidase